MRRLLAATVLPLAVLALQATPALACGGLVAPDGDVHLDRATTFVAWSGGVEHYVTSFAFSGGSTDVGWIVPLPAVPGSVTAAGRWTLQRLELEFAPPLHGAEAEAPAAAPATVLQQVQVEALDITVLRGSGQAVIDWCTQNGFALPADTRAHLLRYAQGTPIFMAARYDNAAAAARGMRAGDGVPLLITMRTPQLWVPLEVLANDGDTVNADLFLLTDHRLRPAESSPLPFLSALGFGSSTSVDGAQGFTVAGAEPLSDTLYAQLSSDRNMSWLPAHGWLTYLRLRAPSPSVTYDLGVRGDGLIRLASFGTVAARTAADDPAARTMNGIAWLGAGTGAATLAAVVAACRMRRRRRFRGAVPPGMTAA